MPQLIAMCCLCHKVKDDEGNYVEQDTVELPADFEWSHTFCRPCFRIKYPDYAYLVDEPVEV